MPRTLRAPIDEQDALWERSAWRLRDAILRFARAMVAGRSTEAATLQIGRLITQTLVLADLLGRRRVILMQDDVMSRRVADRVTPELFRLDDDARLVFTSDPTPMVTPVTFDEMIANILERQPRLAVGYQAVQDIYSREFAFAVAKSVTTETTKRVQKALAEGFRTGAGSKVEQVVAEIGDWSNAYACFLPGTRVLGGAVRASKTWYSGPSVELETEDGRRLRVTANHPVLTSAGWKPAGDVAEGDHLVCHGAPIEPLDALGGANDRASHDDGLSADRRAVDDEDAPTHVEDVFEALRVHGSSRNGTEVPVGPLDFHGDARFTDGKVSEVWTDRKLPVRPHSVTVQFVAEPELVFGDDVWSSPGEGSGVSLPLIHAVPLPCVSFAVGLLDDLKPSSVVPCIHDGPRHLEPLRMGPHRHPCIPEGSTKAPGSDAKFAGDLVESFPGEVTLHRVVHVERGSWTGHVYDLQTETGWISSEGIVTGNCTVYRTNMATAYTAGQFQQAKDPDLAPAFPALEYIGISDSVTRPNHRAAFGLIAATADPIWNEIAPPLGYNDRCGVTIRNKWALMDAGLYRDGIVIRHTPPGFAGAHADHGFQHSAVGTVYR